MFLGLSNRSCLGWAAPCPSGACGEFERPSRSAKVQVAAEAARRTCRASDWRPDKRPRTRRSAECGYAPSLFPPSARCSGGTCGSAGRQGGFQSGTALPPCRSAGRQSRLLSGLSPGRRRRPHHRGKVAGTRVANAGMGDRRGREHPWRAPLYPVCAHSSPSRCGCKPDRQGLLVAIITIVPFGIILVPIFTEDNLVPDYSQTNWIIMAIICVATGNSAKWFFGR